MVQVSIVVPTFKRGDLLNRCLAALFMQSMDPSRYEIIVVDDGPTDETERVVQSWSARQAAPRVRYLAVTKNRGPAAARNLGWRAAEGWIVAFTDDDCIPSPGWLEAGVKAFDDRAVWAVWGRIIVPLPPEPTDWERNVAGLERAPFATANCFYRWRALSAAGGFDERFTTAWREDSDLHFKLLEQGRRCAHQADAVVVHPVRPAPWGISIRLQRANLFNALLYKKHPLLYRQLIQASPPWRYYAVVGAGLLFIIGAAAGWRWVAGGALALWVAVTVRFCLQRLTGTSRRWTHILEMAATSVAIPPLAVFWRIRGAVKYHVIFL